MALDSNIRGSVSGNGAEVTTDNRVKVELETNAADNHTQVGCVRSFSENDTGSILGTPDLKSAEVDEEFRQRSASDMLYDEECFNYTAQNTGKFYYSGSTMANAWVVGSMNTNSGNITTTTTGTTFGSYAFFPILGTQTLSADIEGGFSASPQANTIIDFGFFLRNTSNPYNPTDGVYFRLTSAGLQGVANYNGTETNTGVFETSFGSGTPWTYTPGKKYQFIV